MFACRCGKTFQHEGWLNQHLARNKDNPAHAASVAPIPAPMVNKLDAATGLPLRVEVFVRVNGVELTVAQYQTMVNRLNTVRDSLRHFGPEGRGT